MDQEQVSDAAQALQGFRVIGADRFIAEVAAGRHHRKAELAQQQVVQRRVRQHDAQVGVAGRHLAATGASAPPAQQHDRGLGRSQQAFSRRRHFAAGACLLQVTRHQGKGLISAAVCAHAAGHGRDVTRIHHQMKATQPLDGQDAARTQGSRGPVKGAIPFSGNRPLAGGGKMGRG